MSQLTHINNNVCAPQGFKASGIVAGLKKSLKSDLSLIYSEVPAFAAGVYTKNAIKAAPLLLTRNNVKHGKLQAIITNSGNANSCTGEIGQKNARKTMTALAKQLGIDKQLVAVSSTGVIGVQLPIDKIINKISQLTQELSVFGGEASARAILTTDTFIKEEAVSLTLSNGCIVKIGGIAKGSGMIHPNMATMLAYLTTDINIDPQLLQKSLTLAVNDSFNMISVDGDSSTNDMVLVMANGCAGNPQITSREDADWALFYNGLMTVCRSLAKQIVKDGEGAGKLITVNVDGAKTAKAAKTIAKSVISSTLLKAAMFGNDANWGRIACAVGYSGANIYLEKMVIKLENLVLFNKGLPLDFDEELAYRLLDQAEVEINIELGMGDKSATAWGCDLTYDYVKINAAYRT